MSGVSGSELLILLVIGLIVLGPKRLPEIAAKVGGWIGQARRMTRVMKRQLEDELDLENTKNILTEATQIPFDEDTYSPEHDKKKPATDRKTVGEAMAEPDEDAAEPDGPDEKEPSGE